MKTIGSVRPAYIKRLSREIVDKYEKRLTVDFDENKVLVDSIVELRSKQLRNRVAGYVTRLMRQRHFPVEDEGSSSYEDDEEYD